MNMKQTTSERLNIILHERNLRQADVLEMIKPYCEKYNVRIPRNALSQYFTGKVVPKQDKLAILGMALNVSEAWLMGFDVPRERTDQPIECNDGREKEFLLLFRQLSEEEQLLLIRQMRGLLADQ